MPASASEVAARSMCSTRSSRTLPRCDARAADHERHVRAFVVEKLLAAGVADAVVGHEEDDGVVEDAFLLQPRDHLADLLVGVAARQSR